MLSTWSILINVHIILHFIFYIECLIFESVDAGPEVWKRVSHVLLPADCLKLFSPIFSNTFDRRLTVTEWKEWVYVIGRNGENSFVFI